MGRNGIMGSFQGFDAFGKVRLSLSDALGPAVQLTRWLADHGGCQDPHEDRSSMYAV